MKKILFIALSLIFSPVAYTQTETVSPAMNTEIDQTSEDMAKNDQMVKRFCEQEEIEILSEQEIVEFKEIITQADTVDSVINFLEAKSDEKRLYQNKKFSYIKWILVDSGYKTAQQGTEKDLFEYAKNKIVEMEKSRALAMCFVALLGLGLAMSLK